MTKWSGKSYRYDFAREIPSFQIKSLPAAEAGMAAMLHATVPTRSGGEPDIFGASFGFNVAMQAQVAEALQSLVPEVITPILREVAQDLLASAPLTWILAHWKELVQIYPLRQALVANTQLLPNLLMRVPKGTPYIPIPRDVQNHLAPLIADCWDIVVVNLDAECFTRWCRGSALLDLLQKRVFRRPALYDQAKRYAPAVPWEVLRLEWEARVAVEEYWDANSGRDNSRWKPPHSMPAVRQARLERYVIDFAKARETNEDFGLAFDSQPFWRDIIPEIVVKGIQWEMVSSALRAPANRNDLKHWVQNNDAEKRHAAALAPGITPSIRASLMTHWDFITRLALTANLETGPEVLQKFSQDIHPSVRIVVQARLHRNINCIQPLTGGVLDPSEMLWLLVSHPTTFFTVGPTTYGDGSPEYVAWFKANVGPLAAEDLIDSWAYAGGLLFHKVFYGSGRDVTHLGLHRISQFFKWQCSRMILPGKYYSL